MNDHDTAGKLAQECDELAAALTQALAELSLLTPYTSAALARGRELLARMKRGAELVELERHQAQHRPRQLELDKPPAPGMCLVDADAMTLGIALGLPPHFKLRHVWENFERQRLELQIEGPGLPAAIPGMMLERIRPTITGRSGLLWDFSTEGRR